MLQDLGQWLKRRLKKGIRDQGDAAQKVLDQCGVSVADLRTQWMDQRSAQLSIRNRKSFNLISVVQAQAPAPYILDAPARLKKEIDSVLILQTELDASERTLQTTRTAIEKEQAAEMALEALDSMERTHRRLLEKVEGLYSSLNVQEQFPALDGVNLDFVRTLLLARDLKINIRKRAIGSFFEWDKLDRAVGGKDKALGEWYQSRRVCTSSYSSQARNFTNKPAKRYPSASPHLCPRSESSTSTAKRSNSCTTQHVPFHFPHHSRQSSQNCVTTRLSSRTSGSRQLKKKSPAGSPIEKFARGSAPFLNGIGVEKSNGD